MTLDGGLDVGGGSGRGIGGGRHSPTWPRGRAKVAHPTCFDKRWIYEATYACIVVGAAALILSLVGRHSGWPLGGQYFNELLLVPIYAAHFRHLDLFPVWSSTDGLGIGTLVLLFSQRAFFYVAGTVYVLLGGSLKPTLIISIAAFLVIGAYGMRRALILVTESRLLQVRTRRLESSTFTCPRAGKSWLAACSLGHRFRWRSKSTSVGAAIRLVPKSFFDGRSRNDHEPHHRGVVKWYESICSICANAASTTSFPTSWGSDSQNGGSVHGDPVTGASPHASRVSLASL